MKLAGAAFTLVVLLFWGAMNTLLVLRQREIENLDSYRRGVSTFIGTDLMKERWMAIYKDNKKIGYSGFTIEKHFTEGGVEHNSSIDSAIKVDLFGKGSDIRLIAQLVQDESLKPVELTGTLSFGGRHLRLSGKRDADRFLVAVQMAGVKIVELPLPLGDLVIGNGLTPVLPVAGLEVGETYRVACFDPVTMTRDIVEMRVTGLSTEYVDGFKTDCYTLESEFCGVTSRSKMTRDGLLLRQEFGPPLEGLVLRRQERQAARRGFEP
jgi:hypothetical protein